MEAGRSTSVLRSSDSYVRKEFSETPQGRTAKGVWFWEPRLLGGRPGPLPV